MHVLILLTPDHYSTLSARCRSAARVKMQEESKVAIELL